LAKGAVERAVERKERRMSPADEIAVLQGQVRELADRAAVSGLLDRFVLALDVSDSEDLDDAWYEAVLTTDVRLEFPIGVIDGARGYADYQRSAKAKWECTHHLSGNYIIGLDGDRASVRANVLAVHVQYGGAKHLGVGGYYEGEAVRTAAGWRIRRLAFRMVWNLGDVPAAIGAGQ
jgi:hypothetical protein